MEDTSVTQWNKNDPTKLEERTASFACTIPSPRLAMPKPRKNSVSRKGPPHQERQSDVNDSLSQPLRALHEGLT